MAWRAVRRVDDADQTRGVRARARAVLAAAYVPRAQFRCGAVAPVAGCRCDDVLFSLGKCVVSVPKWHFFSGSRRERRSREALLSEGGARAKERRARTFLILLFLISHGSGTLFHFLSPLLVLRTTQPRSRELNLDSLIGSKLPT